MEQFVLIGQVAAKCPPRPIRCVTSLTCVAVVAIARFLLFLSPG